jgi:hypothetical protein
MGQMGWVRWVWCVVHRGEMGNASKNLIENPKRSILGHLLRVRSFWRRKILLAGQEIASFPRSMNVGYCVHISTPLEPIPRKFNPVRTFIFCLFRIRHNIILPSATRHHKLYLLIHLSTNEETASITWTENYSATITKPHEEISTKQL